MTRVFVAVDIEGVAGVVHPDEGTPGNPEYERARRLMTNEASAVVAGIFDVDPSASVTVADVHGPYRNMIPELLHEQATLLRGKPRHFGMMDGIDDGAYDWAMFVGVHGKAGTDDSVLSHTFTGSILDVVVNGNSWGELGLNAAMAGAYGVPVLLVAGDQSVVAEANGLFGANVVPTVQVKTSRAHLASESVHPNVARRMLQIAAKEALRNPPAVEPLRVEHPVTVEVTLNRPVLADLVAMLDDMERVDGRTVRFTRPDFPNAYRILRLITVLCSAPV
jgi:D-amino peptidase